MRVVVHDYSGHPFQIQLSRRLARRGHDVLHLYSRSIQTPQGSLHDRGAEDGNLEIKGLTLSAPLKKYSFFTRRRQDLEHGRMAAAEIERFGPEVVLSGNTWIDAQTLIHRQCRALGSRFAYWVQDFFGIGIYRLLGKKIPVAGHAVGRFYMARERRLLRESDAVVLIADNFREVLERYGVLSENVHVIENWAPLDEVPVFSKDNDWSRRQGLTDAFCFLYSGTLGMKHNPRLLLDLARRFRDDPGTRVVVVSEGLGADWLAEKKREHGLDNLSILGFQPFEELPRVLASADVLVAVLEPEGSEFSVPSKVLTYLCANRPLLLAVPPDNLASRIVVDTGAGLTVPPDDSAAFVAAAERLRRDPSLRDKAARRGRAYAEDTFDIDRIADKFERALGGRPSVPETAGMTRTGS